MDHNKLWKIPKETGIPDHLTCLLQNLYAGQESTVRTRHGTMDWFQIGKGIRQGYILSPCLFNLYVDYIMRNAGMNEAQAGSRLLGKISITSDIQMTPSLWQKAKRNWRASWESERGEWKSWLKTQHSKNEDYGIQSHHFMANRCGNNETVTDFIFLGSIITMDGDMSLSKLWEMVMQPGVLQFGTTPLFHAWF